MPQCSHSQGPWPWVGNKCGLIRLQFLSGRRCQLDSIRCRWWIVILFFENVQADILEAWSQEWYCSRTGFRDLWVYILGILLCREDFLSHDFVGDVSMIGSSSQRGCGWICFHRVSSLSVSSSEKILANVPFMEDVWCISNDHFEIDDRTLTACVAASFWPGCLQDHSYNFLSGGITWLRWHCHLLSSSSLQMLVWSISPPKY